MPEILTIPDFIELKKDKIQKRFEYFLESINKFKSKQLVKLAEALDLTLGSEKDAAMSLNSAYWFRFQRTFYPFVQSEAGEHTNIRYEKIISAIELTVIEQQPFKCSNQLESYRINAKFALYLSTCLLCAWETFNISKYEELVKTDIKVKQILVYHQTWLTNLDPQYEYPVFINAQFWDVFSELIKRSLIK